MSVTPWNQNKNYKWGKKPSEDVLHREKRKTILRTVEEEKEIKEINQIKEMNRKKAWSNAWDQRWQLSKHQKAAGARKIL